MDDRHRSGPDGSVEAPRSGITSLQVGIFAVASGLSVANIYYSQPLIGLIAPALGLHPGLAGLIVTLIQLGYGAGLLLVVPLSDVSENRRLVLLRSVPWRSDYSGSVSRRRRHRESPGFISDGHARARSSTAIESATHEITNAADDVGAD